MVERSWHLHNWSEKTFIKEYDEPESLSSIRSREREREPHSLRRGHIVRPLASLILIREWLMCMTLRRSSTASHKATRLVPRLVSKIKSTSLPMYVGDRSAKWVASQTHAPCWFTYNCGWIANSSLIITGSGLLREQTTKRRIKKIFGLVVVSRVAALRSLESVVLTTK